MSFITSHWELKLVALVLAVALWIYTSGQVRSDRTVDVQLREASVTGLGDNYEITLISPKEFRVTLSVPSSRWGDMPANDLLLPRIEVRQDALKNRQQDFAVTSATLGLPSDIRIVRTEPENLREITVHWDYIVEDDMPAEPPVLANVPTGLEAEARLDVSLVRVRAAADVVERQHQMKNRVRFQPVDLGFVDPKGATEQVQTVALRPVPNLPYKVQRSPSATITLRPVPSSMPVSSLPLQILIPRDAIGRFQVDLSQPQVTLTVRGPENLLKKLQPETDITAYIDLRHALEAGTHEVPVSLLAPAWLTFDPTTVRATVSPAPPAESAPAPEPSAEVHAPPAAEPLKPLPAPAEDVSPPEPPVSTPPPGTAPQTTPAPEGPQP